MNQPKLQFRNHPVYSNISYVYSPYGDLIGWYFLTLTPFHNCHYYLEFFPTSEQMFANMPLGGILETFERTWIIYVTSLQTNNP